MGRLGFLVLGEATRLRERKFWIQTSCTLLKNSFLSVAEELSKQTNVLWWVSSLYIFIQNSWGYMIKRYKHICVFVCAIVWVSQLTKKSKGPYFMQTICGWFPWSLEFRHWHKYNDAFNLIMVISKFFTWLATFLMFMSK